ncbi:hypothetical protein [Paractinoplanes atraurantiacus]|uniref:Lipoprotein n=1 Tax=Paractinoplanes atraurantiacus TaxID=1036182 RepID=A0A285EZA1_9ACTN|nr:hypothetical protein [Actinoplanes atraurantiacus]SNY03744.1 hypothetical protein SAMN05421748_1017 [Actinoplanes atraurantiacus]
MRRVTLTLVVAGVTLAAGCAKQPQQVAGEAFPMGGASPSPSAVTTSSVSTPSSSSSSSTPPSSSPTPSTTSAKPRTSSSPPKTSSPPPPKVSRVIGPAGVLGPTGFGKLQIGMTVKEAEATGLVWAGEGEAGCGSWYLKADGAGESTVGWSSRGVVSIPAYGDIATPEGIKIGSSLAAADEAYSDLSGQAAEKGSTWGEGLAYAGKADKYGNVHYRFTFVNGAVASLVLEHDNPKC